MTVRETEDSRFRDWEKGSLVGVLEYHGAETPFDPKHIRLDGAGGRSGMIIKMSSCVKYYHEGGIRVGAVTGSQRPAYRVDAARLLAKPPLRVSVWRDGWQDSDSSRGVRILGAILCGGGEAEFRVPHRR